MFCGQGKGEQGQAGEGVGQRPEFTHRYCESYIQCISIATAEYFTDI